MEAKPPSDALPGDTGRIADVAVDGVLARVHRALPEHDRAAWAAGMAPHCHDHRYFDLVGRTITDRFDHLRIVLSGADGRARAVQPAFLVREDLLTGVPAGIVNMLAPVRRVWPGFLMPRMLMVGCATGEGVLAGANADERRWTGESLGKVLTPLARKLGASLIVLKDFPIENRPFLDGPMAKAGLTRMPSMPGAGLELAFTSFDDYLAKRCSKSRRADLRRKFRDAVADGPIEMEVVSDISPWIDEAYGLYLQVYERATLRFEKLTKEFLRGLGAELGDRARFFIWRRKGEMVAFNLCLVHDDGHEAGGGVLRDCYIGLEYRVALDLHLYFLSWRDIVEWCIKNGVHRYWTAPLNYDPKLNLKMRLEPLDLYTRHASGIINPAFGRIVKFFGPTRFDPVLPKFANYADL